MSKESATNTNTTPSQLSGGDNQTQPYNDPCSPYFLHPSVNSGTVFMTCVLNRDNYLHEREL